jgi:N-acyl-D-amino-acid deacylase
MKTFATLLIACGMTAGLRAQIPDFTPQTPLLGALIHNDVVEARRMVESGADPNQGHFNGLPPILMTALRQDAGLVRLMAGKGADLNARDRSGSMALMWAALSETGESSVVEELLRLGADPGATNIAGETALDWALRRGETPAVEALRKAGGSNLGATTAAVENAISLLQKSGAQFLRVSGCTSCHHQVLPQLAMGIARPRAIRVDESAARQQVSATVALLRTVADEAVQNRDRIPDVPISVSYALVGLASEQYPADELTDAMAKVVAAWQSEDGAFYTLPPMRPPLEASDFTATALSLRAIQLYGKDPQERIQRARNWLLTSQPKTNEDRAMQLLGLAWGRASTEELKQRVVALLAEQRTEGGWGQLSTLESDAYATGQALVALQAAGLDVASAEYQRGVGFLLRTQFPDGSWLVRSRAFPVQPLKDSGFPHGKDQWISAAGTSWAAMALGLAIPEWVPHGGSN